MTCEIKLTLGYVTLVDDADFERLSAFPWYAMRQKRSDGTLTIYAYRKDGPRRIVYMHREVACAPAGVKVDHRNRDTLDNRSDNLRSASNRQNAINRVYTNKCGYRGAHSTGAGFYAAIRVEGDWRYLGKFPTAIEAARAYDEAALIHHGAFAVLNFPRPGDTANVT